MTLTYWQFDSERLYYYSASHLFTLIITDERLKYQTEWKGKWKKYYESEKKLLEERGQTKVNRFTQNSRKQAHVEGFETWLLRLLKLQNLWALGVEVKVNNSDQND